MRTLSMMTAGIVVLLTSPGLAGERSELEKAAIKAASDCVAAAALNNPNITSSYREGRLKEIPTGSFLSPMHVRTSLPRCGFYTTSCTGQARDGASFSAIILPTCREL